MIYACAFAIIAILVMMILYRRFVRRLFSPVPTLLCVIYALSGKAVLDAWAATVALVAAIVMLPVVMWVDSRTPVVKPS